MIILILLQDYHANEIPINTIFYLHTFLQHLNLFTNGK